MEPIEIDDEVFALIKAEAEPFTDTPNSALRRLLGLEAGVKDATEKAAAGSILPRKAYEAPILQALAEKGGSAHAKEVTDRVGELLDGELSDKDRGKLKSGQIRWRNRVQFTRMELVNRGLLEKDSDYGVWQLTDAGKASAEGGDA